MEANPKTVGHLLRELFPGCDIAPGLERVQTVGEFLEELLPGWDIDAGLTRIHAFIETLANQMSSGLERVGEMVERLENGPAVPGYETLLVGRGHPLTRARGASSWLIRVGKEEAKKAPKQRIVADTLRFLAKPGRTKGSISRKAAALIEVCNTTAALSDVFRDSEISLVEFVEALEGAVRGELAACLRVTEVAAALAPGLSVRRGPKISAASIAHQMLLQLLANTAGPKSYTSNPIIGDFTDPLTHATRTAFNNPKFDPRPAFRRHKVCRQQKSN
jgi:hypothetical protein